MLLLDVCLGISTGPTGGLSAVVSSIGGPSSGSEDLVNSFVNMYCIIASGSSKSSPSGTLAGSSYINLTNLA